MTALVVAVIDAALSAMTIAFYADYGGSWILAVGIFCGLLTFVQIAMYHGGRR